MLLSTSLIPLTDFEAIVAWRFVGKWLLLLLWLWGNWCWLYWAVASSKLDKCKLFIRFDKGVESHKTSSSLLRFLLIKIKKGHDVWRSPCHVLVFYSIHPYLLSISPDILTHPFAILECGVWFVCCRLLLLFCCKIAHYNIIIIFF